MTANNNVIWHYKVGHTHPKAINHVLELCSIRVNNKKYESFCHACCLDKSHGLHALLTHTKYSSAFELIQTNLFGGRGFHLLHLEVDTLIMSPLLTLIQGTLTCQKSDALNAFKFF